MFPNQRGLIRSQTGKRIVSCLGAVAALFLCTPTRAVAPAPLPSFSVQGLDGSTVSTATWPLKGNSVLIYVEGNCQPCATLLGRLLKKDYPQLASHATIVVGGLDPAGTKALLQLYPDLSSAIWYADPPRAAVSALSLQGAPVTMGLKGNVVQWVWSGVMQDPTRQRSILNTWCGK